MVTLLPPFVGQEFRIKKETTYKTAPAAIDTRLGALQLGVTPMYEKEPFTPSGSRLPTGVQPIDAATELELSGPLSFSDIVWPLSSIFGPPVTSAAGTGWSHVWTHNGVTLLNPNSYAIHYGDATLARQILGAIFTGLSFETNREGALEMTSPGFGAPMTTGITGASSPPWAASPTNIAPVPVGPLLFSIWLDTTSFANIGTTQLLYCFNANFEVGERYQRVRPINRLLTSDGVSETADQEISVSLNVAADATGDTLIASLAADQMVFVRLQAEGAIFNAAHRYTLQFDFAMLFSDSEEIAPAQDSVAAYTLNGVVARDTVSGSGLIVTVKNTIAAASFA